MAGDWMIYGANGYTGELVAERAKAMGLSPVLAGRQAEKLRPIADKLGLPLRAFSLDDPHAVDRALTGVEVVLHCAGPFSQTARPMVDGCVRSGTHYLDITGEVAVFEQQFARDAEFRKAGITVISGVGFDVVPTDCMAAALKRALPDAMTLELAFGGFAKMSKGTAKSMIEGLPNGGLIRKGGKLTEVPTAHSVKDIPFGDKPRKAMSIPWGDVSTAFRTTSIPNITVYMAASAGLIRMARLGSHIRGLLGRSAVQSFLKSRAEGVKGPSAEDRATGRVHLWGRVENAAGQVIEGVGECPEGYALTVEASLACVKRLRDQPPPHGALTPAGAFGPELLTSLPDCTLTVPRPK